MRLLSHQSPELPIHRKDDDKRGRRLLLSRNALSPLQKQLSKLRRPPIIALLVFSTFLILLILRREHRRTSDTFAALRTPPPKDVTPPKRTPSAKIRQLDKVLLQFNGLGGTYLGVKRRSRKQLEPSYLEPLTLDGEMAQKLKRGIYGSSSIAWSSGVAGVGTYLGPLTYKQGIPHTVQATQDPPKLDPSRTELEVAIDGIVRRSPVVVFSKTTCPFSKRAKDLLRGLELVPEPYIIEVDQRSDTADIKSTLKQIVDHDTFPTIFIGGRMIGGSDDLSSLNERDRLMKRLNDAGAFFNDYEDL